MPEIVFDYNAIREHLRGDDWYQPQRDMVEAACRAEQCVQQREPTPDEYLKKAGSAGIPCTAPTPPIPCGQAPNPPGCQPANPFGQQAGCNQQDRAAGVVGGIARPEWMQELVLKNVPPAIEQAQCDGDARSAVVTLVNVIDGQMLQEKCKFQEKLARFQSMIEQVRTRRDRVHYENAIEDEHKRYQQAIAPMVRQKEWLINQLAQTMAVPNFLVKSDCHEEAFADSQQYIAEPVREIDVAQLKKGYKPGRKS